MAWYVMFILTIIRALMKVKYPELFKACPAAEKFQEEFQRNKGEFQRWSD
jgi:hypothetical protein